MLTTFSIITTEPNAEMAEIHTRMPVILSTEAEREAWLSNETAIDTLLYMCQTPPNGLLQMYRVSEKLNLKIFMRVVIQRVKEASVTIDAQIKSAITEGLLILVGVEDADTAEDIKWLAAKIVNLRIFGDENGLMNRSVMDIQGEMLVVSQFTLHASTKKGNRPSFLRAAKPDFAVPMYEQFVAELVKISGLKVLTGIFGADMKVTLLNDGPVTIVIDSKNKE